MKDFYVNLVKTDLKDEVLKLLKKKFKDQIKVVGSLDDKPSYFIIDTDTIPVLSKEFLRKHGARVILLSDQDDEFNVLNFIVEYPINHLIGINGPHFIHELENNLHKILDKNIWGLKQYLEENARIIEEGIEQDGQIDRAIETSLEKLDYSSYFESPKNYLLVMANELLTNALYNGVATREKLNPSEGLDRSKGVFLKGSEHILFTVGSDSFAIGISVQDSFGKLDRDIVIKNLKRSFVEKVAQEKKRWSRSWFLYDLQSL
jgi:sigma-B regulation protein RsbU (phosphoserine phosphatase)